MPPRWANNAHMRASLGDTGTRAGPPYRWHLAEGAGAAGEESAAGAAPDHHPWVGPAGRPACNPLLTVERPS